VAFFLVCSQHVDLKEWHRNLEPGNTYLHCGAVIFCVFFLINYMFTYEYIYIYYTCIYICIYAIYI